MDSLNSTSSYTGLQRRDAREMVRSASRIRAGASTGLAQIDATASIFSEVLAVAAGLTSQAMAHTVQIAQAEAIGAQMAPHAAGRLQYLANQHALGASDVVADALRSLGRQARR